LCTGATFAQGPIAYNDTVTVVQFSSDTINVAAIDSSPSGDSLCLFKIYGSPNFALINCSDIVYRPDTTFTGWDSCHYITCNAGDTLLCDTAVLVVDVTTYYRPFMLRNSKWVVVVYGNGCLLDGIPPDYSDYVSLITGNTDTIINGFHYYPMVSLEDNYDFACLNGGPGGPLISASHSGPDLFGYLRQDTAAKKVYYLPPGSNTDTVIYNFDLVIGDSIIIPNITTVYLTSFGYSLIGGTYYKNYNFSSAGGTAHWIEGLGSINGLFSPFNFVESGGPYLLCFSHNDTVIWPTYNPDSSCANGNIISSVSIVKPNPGPRIFPNPANNSITITGIKSGSPIIIINLLGQVLVNEISEGETQTLDISRLAAGMYFVNKMKLVKE